MIQRRNFLYLLGAAPLLTAQSLSLADQQLLKLLDVRTVYVGALGGEGAGPIRDMLIGSLQRLGIFVLTENEEAADAVLRGSAEDLIYQESASFRSGINVRGSSSASRREDGDSRYDQGSFGVGENESGTRRERKHEASAAVRLVLRNGEVIWSTTKESDGGRFQGSAAHVAEQVAEELEDAHEKARLLAGLGTS